MSQGEGRDVEEETLDSGAEAPQGEPGGADTDPGPWGEEAVRLGGADAERQRRVQMVTASGRRRPTPPRRATLAAVVVAALAILAASAAILSGGWGTETATSPPADDDTAQAAARLEAQRAAAARRAVHRAQRRRLVRRRAARRRELVRRQHAAQARKDADSAPSSPTYAPSIATSEGYEPPAPTPETSWSGPAPPASGETVEREFGFER